MHIAKAYVPEIHVYSVCVTLNIAVMRHDAQEDRGAYVSKHLVIQTHQLETKVQFADDWPATSCFAGSSGMCQDGVGEAAAITKLVILALTSYSRLLAGL